MSNLRDWIDLVEGIVNLSDYQAEPTNMTPDVQVGNYVIHAAKKNPESTRFLDYVVWIEGPDRDENDHIDIRRYARGAEPKKMQGIPDMTDVSKFTDFAKRADTLADYGVEKPPEVRFNPAWVLWRKNAILNMAKRYGLDEAVTEGIAFRQRDLVVYSNPNRQQFKTLQTNAENNVRGILHFDTLYIWNAFFAEHTGIAKSLGLNDNDCSFIEFDKDEVIFNWSENDQESVLRTEALEKLRSSRAIQHILGPNFTIRNELW